MPPLLPLLPTPLPPLHADGLGWDEFLPGVLAVLIALGVYTVIAGGGEAPEEADTGPAGDGTPARSPRRSRRRNSPR